MALEQLSRDRLLDITDDLGLYVEDRRIAEQHISAIVRSRSVDFASILQGLTRDELKDICDALDLDDSGREKAPLIERILNLGEEGDERPSESRTGSNAPLAEAPLAQTSLPGPAQAPQRDAKKVFIIHGREKSVLQELKHFLKALGLQAWTFDNEHHEATPNTHIAEIVSRGVAKTRAVIALLTPDEFASLAPDLRQGHEPDRNLQRWQPRPNVIYEAGMAMGMNREGTILVTVGHLELPSDLDGILHFRLTNDIESRRKLRHKLKQAGCAVDPDLEDWMDSSQGGDFKTPPTRPAPPDPFTPHS
ncbi:TIR domain-containing protein [Pyxidicoccus caerfyrddinensis]|uniref:TIR domain-containing protein n=1 Tax=Pyxidicoccus caerfyrddinensis TaxID=2709663 RepID=UPI0019676232|nr:TIR domain-containing protein [Pyxidicoccus caerfyrddinensis]